MCELINQVHYVRTLHIERIVRTEVSARRMRRVTIPSVNAKQSTRENCVKDQLIIALLCLVKMVGFVIPTTQMMVTRVNACQVSAVFSKLLNVFVCLLIFISLSVRLHGLRGV